MTTAQLADFLARHLWTALGVVTVVMLLLAWLLWYALGRYGPCIDTLVNEWWIRLRPHVTRLPLPASLVGAVPYAWRLARKLGVQAVLSIVVALLACMLFVEIAGDIGLDDDLGRFDVELSAALKQHAGDQQLRFFAILTDLGDKAFLIPLSVGIALVLLLRRHWFLAAAWAVATSGGALMNVLLKAIFERARPEHVHGFATASGWSFPSGHSSGSFIVYGLLGYLAVIHTPKSCHLPVAALAMMLVVCVGFSRVILQVHYFSDVLGGYAFGASWLAAWIAGLEVLRRGEPRATPA